MWKWLKSLFCRHVWYSDNEYAIVQDDWIMNTSTCRKCGNKLYSAVPMYGKPTRVITNGQR